jgi:hypothetical protein
MPEYEQLFAHLVKDAKHHEVFTVVCQNYIHGPDDNRGEVNALELYVDKTIRNYLEKGYSNSALADLIVQEDIWNNFLGDDTLPSEVTMDHPLIDELIDIIAQHLSIWISDNYDADGNSMEE